MHKPQKDEPETFARMTSKKSLPYHVRATQELERQQQISRRNERRRARAERS